MSKKPKFKVGELVLVQHEGYPKGHFIIGRITAHSRKFKDIKYPMISVKYRTDGYAINGYTNTWLFNQETEILKFDIDKIEPDVKYGRLMR